MKILGIIAEYNPFHSGHSYHIRESMEKTGSDAVIAVMSGNFVQRGEPSIADKFARSQMAVKGGADIVFELPFVYAVNSAQYFAKGAIRLLEGIGCIDTISFGSEEGDLRRLDIASELLANESRELSAAIKNELGKGISYPKARENALSMYMDCSDGLLKNPNNILATEYLIELKKRRSDIKPFTIKRKGQGYSEGFYRSPEDNDISDMIEKGGHLSAASIRNMIISTGDISAAGSSISKETAEILERAENKHRADLRDLYSLLQYRLVTADPEELKNVLAASEGIENRMIREIRDSSDIYSFIKKVLSKRYTETGIKRLIIQTVAGLTKDDFEKIDSNEVMYARVLAASSKGTEIIGKIKKSGNCGIKIITNINKERTGSREEKLMMSYDIKASDIYNMITGRSLYRYSDMVRKPYIEI